MSEDRTDRRIAGETHINRINGWAGSDSRIEGCRRDPEDVDPVPALPKLPFRVPEKSYHGDKIRRPGEIVELYPHQAGAHHGRIMGVEYPSDACLALMLERHALAAAPPRHVPPPMQPYRRAGQKQLRGV